MNKLQTLQSALEPRNDEILNYQINIDNYTRAITKINDEHADNLALIEFRDNLSDMVESHKTEQLKAIIIRDVIADQITELEASSKMPRGIFRYLDK
jgi:Cys-tRNA synthase (O-phospho-L-seryl-tRNA:Cys-tRNA synthase)